jgi:hypothetical protein
MFWGLDRRSYSLFTPEYFRHVSYWSGSIYEFPYQKVENIKVECRIGKKDKLIIEYSLIINSEEEYDVIYYDTPKELRAGLRNTLRSLLKLDGKLRSLNIPNNMIFSDRSMCEKSMRDLRVSAYLKLFDDQ